MLRGPGVLVGDLNDLRTHWDDTNNARGSVLRTWAMRHNFRTQCPPGPACQTRSGQSRVDIIFAHLSTAPVISLLPSSSCLDHIPVKNVITLSSPSTISCIPLSYINNAALQTHIREGYRRTLPSLIAAINRAEAAPILEQVCARLMWAITEPCPVGKTVQTTTRPVQTGMDSIARCAGQEENPASEIGLPRKQG